MKNLFIFSIFLLATNTQAAPTCAHSFIKGFREPSRPDLIYLNPMTEGGRSLIGRTINIDFKDRPSLNNILVTDFTVERVNLGDSMRRDIPTLTYVQRDGTEQKLFSEDLIQVSKIAVKVTPGKGAKSYEEITSGWTEFALDKYFSVPSVIGATGLPEFMDLSSLIGKKVALLTFPAFQHSAAPKVHSQIIIGQFIGGPLYQTKSSYTIRTESGKLIEVEMYDVRRFRAFLP